MDNDFEKTVKDIKELFEFREVIWPEYEKELQMWRTKFIESLDEYKTNEIVKKYFNRAAPSHILRDGPLKCAEEIGGFFARGACKSGSWKFHPESGSWKFHPDK